MSSLHLTRVRTLYKAILKLHKGLPPELNELGSIYTRDEFKRHKKCTPEEAHVFMVEWSRYALNLAEQLGLKGAKSAKPLGNSFKDDHLDNFREDQIAQLYELKLAAEGQESADPNNAQSHLNDINNDHSDHSKSQGKS